MPWRNSKDPYIIWISEIILQQTQVKQGTPYFNKFIETFPTLNHLASANEDELLKLWQGLGYYSRARNMHLAAKHIIHNLNGEFPATYSELLKLKGVGDYTASAIASIAFNEPVAVLDGNVIRVIARLFELEDSVQTGKGVKKFKTYAEAILNTLQPGIHNEAMMELGSLICKPSQPLCNLCPISEHCQAYLNKSTDRFPIKKNKIKVRDRYFNFIVPVFNSLKTLLVKRTGNDIWENLYTFPHVETKTEWDQLHAANFVSKIPFLSHVEIVEIKKIKHVLSHQNIHSVFVLINVTQQSDLKRVSEYLVGNEALNPENVTPILNQEKFARLEKSNIFEVDLNELNTHYAMPRLISKFLESNEWNLNLN